jgi:DNA-binding protein HU-beta
MRKDEFAEKLGKRVDETPKHVANVVDAAWEVIAETLKKGDEVVFPFGKFVVNKRPAREGRNPFTGETIKIPAKIVPQFKPAKKFKDHFKK